jgi:hypothetical protein
MENVFEVFDETHYGNGEFGFVRDEQTKEFLKSAHNAISLCELWNWLRMYEPLPNKGFMWSKTPEIDRINQQLWKDTININHSGSSYGVVMREMEYIAKNGYNNYKTHYESKQLF